MTTSATSTKRARKLWIDSAWRDLALYIGTPLFLLPFILLMHGRPAIEEVLLYIGAFGALGHHLPGMMRAYGDRGLFRRFRVRFVLAPLFLVPVCVLFSVNGLGGVLLVTFLWTNWHSLMQIFGFARIYDAKPGLSTVWTSRLDQALCVAWIGAPLLLSDSRLGSLLELFYESGGPLLAPALVTGLRDAWLIGAVGVTAVWAVHTLIAWRAGRAPNPAKLLLFASSFTFWWFCMAMVDNLLVGVALFDIFHDVQYLALVWTFNRARVASDPSVGGFSRFLFRGRFTLAGIYVGMVVAYGSLGYASEWIDQVLARQVLIGVLAASALLHFYFDGFIWKVRERSTRAGLSVAGGGADIRLGGAAPGWLVHGSKWLLFVVPLATLYWWETHDARDERVWRAAIVEVVPNSGEALTSYAAALDPGTAPDEVLAWHRRAIEAKPTHPVAYNNYGAALFVLGRFDEALAAFRQAVRLFPGYSVAHRHLGSLLMTLGQVGEAEEHFEDALAHDERDGSAYAGLGAIHAHRGETGAAVASFERALELEPTNRTALNGLAWTLATHPDAAYRDGARAVEYANELVRLTDPPDPMVLDTAAAAFAEAGRIDDALNAVSDAIDLAREIGRPDVANALELHRQRFELGEAWRGGR